MWVMTVKHNPDGSISRYKARTVAKGFTQRPGFDYNETYAPTFRQASLRLIAAMAAQHDLHMHSVDVTAAFTNGDLDETIYMHQPEGFHDGPSGSVCALDKAIYGLKQAARQWNLKLHAAMLSMGFTRLKSDSSIYLFVRDKVRIIMPVYVDDITFVSADKLAIARAVEELFTHFQLRDLGPTSYLLGIEIERNWANRTVSLCQHRYIVDKLALFGMADCRPVKTPMVPGTRLEKASAEDAATVDKELYMRSVGALMYLATSTRPDIAYTVGCLARFSSNPGSAHVAAFTHLFRYLQGTKDLKLVYCGNVDEGEPFKTYTDADHGGEPDGGKSTDGYLVRMGGGAVSWRSKLQPVVTLSTTEAEYVAAVEAGKEIKWMRSILAEFGYPCSSASTLLIDSQSALQVAKNPDHHGRMKHLDLRYYWLRDEVDSMCPQARMRQTCSPSHLSVSRRSYSVACLA